MLRLRRLNLSWRPSLNAHLLAGLNDFQALRFQARRQTGLVYIHVVSSCMDADKSAVGTSLKAQNLSYTSKVVLLISSVFHALQLLFNVGVDVFLMLQCKLS